MAAVMNKPSNINLGFPFKECETCNMCKPVINETDSRVDYGKILYDISCENEDVCSMWKCRIVAEGK